MAITLGGQEVRKTLVYPRSVVGMDVLLNRFERVDDGGRGESEDAIDLVGPADVPRPQVAIPVAELGDLLSAGETRLARAQCILGPQALGDVAQHRHCGGNAPGLIADWVS